MTGIVSTSNDAGSKPSHLLLPSAAHNRCLLDLHPPVLPSAAEKYSEELCCTERGKANVHGHMTACVTQSERLFKRIMLSRTGGNAISSFWKASSKNGFQFKPRQQVGVLFRLFLENCNPLPLSEAPQQRALGPAAEGRVGFTPAAGPRAAEHRGTALRRDTHLCSPTATQTLKPQLKAGL